MNHRSRAVLLFVIVLCFGVLVFGGAQISRHKPPIPERVVAPSGEVVLTGDDIRLGQRQYLSRGGQQTGSIWGHGAYLAPDWSADVLHRIGLASAGLAHGLPAASPAEARPMRWSTSADQSGARYAPWPQIDPVCWPPRDRYWRWPSRMSSPVRTTSPDGATTRSGMGGLCREIWAPPNTRTPKHRTMTKRRTARLRWFMASGISW